MERFDKRWQYLIKQNDDKYHKFKINLRQSHFLYTLQQYQEHQE